MALKTALVILAGGKSSRMMESLGVDKALLKFQEKSLSHYRIDRFLPYFDEIYLSAKSKEKFTDSFLHKYILTDATQIGEIDLTSCFAPTVAIFTALQILKEDFVVILAVDTPFVSVKSLQKMIEVAKTKNATAVVARVNGKIHPTCAVYSKNCLDKLQETIIANHHKLTLFLQTIDTIFVDFDDSKEFTNINDANDYKEILCNLHI